MVKHFDKEVERRLEKEGWREGMARQARAVYGLDVWADKIWLERVAIPPLKSPEDVPSNAQWGRLLQETGRGSKALERWLGHQQSRAGSHELLSDAFCRALSTTLKYWYETVDQQPGMSNTSAWHAAITQQVIREWREVALGVRGQKQ